MSRVSLGTNPLQNINHFYQEYISEQTFWVDVVNEIPHWIFKELCQEFAKYWGRETATKNSK